MEITMKDDNKRSEPKMSKKGNSNNSIKEHKESLKFCSKKTNLSPEAAKAIEEYKKKDPGFNESI